MSMGSFAAVRFRALATAGWCLVLLVANSICVASPHVPSYERWSGSDTLQDAEAGQLLLGELNCTSCHQGGAAAAAFVSRKQAPILDEIASRAKADHIRAYLLDPQKVKPGTTMPSLFSGVAKAEAEAQVEALTHYLASKKPAGPDQTFAPIGGRTRGEMLYHTVGCVACHGANKDGAKLLSSDKPLGNLDSKYTLPALSGFLQDPLHVRPSGRMPSLNLSSLEARDIAAYLLPSVPEKTGLAYKYYEGSWQKLPDFDKLTPKASGGTDKIHHSLAKRGDNFGLRFEGSLVIDKEGDYTFHVGSDDGSWLKIDGKMVANNDGIHGFAWKSGKVRLTKGTHLVQVDMFEQAGGEQIEAEFEGPGIPRQKIANAISAASPKAEIESLAFKVNPALVEKGRALFATVGCASCHSMTEGDKPIASQLKAKALTALAGSGGCLSAAPAKGTANYDLTAAQRKVLVAGLASLGGQAKLASKEVIHRTFNTLNCYACHKRDGKGGPVEANQVYFEGTQPEMGDEGRIPPFLDGVGGKLTAEWLGHILKDGAKDRPYMKTRMPKFGEQNAGVLLKPLEELDKLPPLPPVAIAKKEASIGGWQLVGNKGFSCIKCHTFGRFRATGVQSIDMTIMNKRLREEWFRRYVDTPQLFRRGTRMPDAWPSNNGKSLLPKILDGRNETQIQAVWTYLADGKRARTPSGLVTNSMELIPSYEAVIYRNFIQGAGPRAIGVGYPEQMSLAFDANDLRLALLWKGAFIDASRHWSGRGQGYQGPAGQAVVTLPAGTTFALLEKPETAWPTTSPKENGYKFLGYRLSEDRRPTFSYKLKDITIKDFPTPVEAGVKTLLKRTYTITADKPVTNLYLRAGTGQVTEGADGWYSVNNVKVRLTGGKVMVRDGKELLVQVQFTGNTATLTQEYDW